MKAKMSLYRKKSSYLQIAALSLGLGIGSNLDAQVNYFSDFNDGVPDWDFFAPNGVPPSAAEINGQLSIRAQFPATAGFLTNSLSGVFWSRNHGLRDAETLEYSVDLIQTSRPDVLAGFDYNATTIPGEGLYVFWKNADRLFLAKVIPIGAYVEAIFFNEATPIKNENVRMSMALTRIGGSVSITCRVLDLDAAGAVLFEKTVVDTPAVDPTVPNVPGLTPESPDSGPPFGLTGSSGAFLFLGQVTDGTQPEAEVIYDNFTWEYRSAAELTVEPAVRLSWPAFSTPLIVEGAPTVDGPWSLVNEPVTQTNGTNWMTVPAPLSQVMQVFRLREETP